MANTILETAKPVRTVAIELTRSSWVYVEYTSAVIALIKNPAAPEIIIFLLATEHFCASGKASLLVSMISNH